MNTTTQPEIDDVCDMLKNSFGEVFSTMYQMAVESSSIVYLGVGDEVLVAGAVGFVGEVNGMIYIYVEATLARTLAGRMLGLPEAEIESDEIVNDVIGEMTNMVVGAVKSRLCDLGAPCKLTIPSILRGKSLHAQPTGSSESRLLCFASESGRILVEIFMKPTT